LDPVELLDVLGNENRRRILQLLSFRPFYFNEIAKRLDVGPKAVIDHLEMLEQAGLVECYTDQRRRKYFRIARNLVLEVAVSPHSYGVRAYRQEGISTVDSSGCDLKLLQTELRALEKRRGDLRKLLEEVGAREAELRSRAVEEISKCAQNQLEAEILVALLSGPSTAKSLADKLEVPSVVVEESLKAMAGQGFVREEAGLWTL
jgi:ArsR family transcriptional regulator